MNILVTGALGFIGSNFVNYMAAKYPDHMYIVLDKLSYCSSLENITPSSGNVRIVVGNISDENLVLDILFRYGIDTVVHFAAETHVDDSFLNSVNFTVNNVLGTHKLLETCWLWQQKVPGAISRFIHVSTDEVYGEVTNDVARREDAKFRPTNPYAATKCGAEFIVQSYYHSYNFPVIITRSNNVFGPRQYPEKIVPLFINKLLKNEKLTIHGRGDQLRSFIYIDDIVTAFETILFRGVIGETYNIGTDHEYSVMDVAEIILKEFYYGAGIDLNDYIEYVKDRNFQDKRYLISSEKLQSLGWKESDASFQENIRKTIKFYSTEK